MRFVDVNGNYAGRSCCWWQAPLNSAEVVFKVISLDSSNSTFFKNAGLSTRSLKPSSAAEQVLLEDLAAQKQKKAAITEEFAKLRKRSEAAEEALLKTQQLYEDMKKQQEENNLILHRFLQANSAGISSQPWSSVITSGACVMSTICGGVMNYMLL